MIKNLTWTKKFVAIMLLTAMFTGMLQGFYPAEYQAGLALPSVGSIRTNVENRSTINSYYDYTTPITLGDKLLVTWYDDDYYTHSTLVNSDGTSAEMSPINISPKTNDNSDTILYKELSDGKILVYWYSSSSGTGLADAYFKVISQAGYDYTGSIRINSIPATGYDLNRFVQVDELSNGNLAFVWATNGTNYALRRFAKDGTVVDASQISITDLAGITGQSQYTHSIVAGNNGNFMIMLSYYNVNYLGMMFENDSATPIQFGGQNTFVVSSRGELGNEVQYLKLLPDGKYLAVYQKIPSGDYSNRSIAFKIYNSDGSVYANEKVVRSIYTWGYISEPIILDNGFTLSYMYGNYNTSTFTNYFEFYDYLGNYVGDLSNRLPSVNSQYGVVIPFRDCDGKLSLFVNDEESGNYNTWLLRNAAASISNITSAGISGIVAPASGETPVSISNLAPNAGTYTVSGLEWQNSDGSPATLTADGKFKQISTYKAVVTLTSSTGNKFPSAGLTPTVSAGTPQAGTVSGGDVSGNTLTFTILFDETEDTTPVEVTAYNSEELAFYIPHPNVQIINLVGGTEYHYDGGTIAKNLTINGNGATIITGAGVADTIKRSNILSDYLGNVLFKVQGSLHIENVTLKNGGYRLRAVFNAKDLSYLNVYRVNFKDYYNSLGTTDNDINSDTNNFGVHAEPNASYVSVGICSFDDSNAFRNAVAIRGGTAMIHSSTFMGTSHPERLNYSDGYEYGIYLYGGSTTVISNNISGYDSSRLEGYTSSGLAMLPYYKVSAQIISNTINNNSVGIDLAGSWKEYFPPDADLTVNGLIVNTEENGYSLGELFKTNNSIFGNAEGNIFIKLDQDDLDNACVYYSPMLNDTSATPYTGTLNITNTNKVKEIISSAITREMEKSEDNGQSWTTASLVDSFSSDASSVSVNLQPGRNYMLRVKTTHYRDSSNTEVINGYSESVFINTPPQGEISPSTGDFDKNVTKQADVSTTVSLNGSQLSSITKGSTPLISGVDYSISGNTVNIKKEYLSKQVVGSLTLTFNFNSGSARLLTINIVDTTPIPISVNGITASNKIYDGTTDASITIDGAYLTGIGDDDVSIDFSNVTASFSDANAQANKTVTVAGLALKGADSSKYVLQPYTTTAEILPKGITVTAVAKSKVYGGQDPELTCTVEGLVESDTLSGALLRDLGESVNEYNITQGSLANSNYAITYVPAKFTITPKSITVTAAAKSKIYGGQDPELTYTVEGLVGSDKLSGALLRESGENVNEYNITQGSLANSNYAITFVPAKFTIAQKAVTVTAHAKSKIYGSQDPELTYTVEGLVESDTLSGALLRESGENVNEYSITQGSLANSNYAITFVPAKFTIAQKAVTVTAQAKSKVYGSQDPELTYTVEGLVESDTLSGSLLRESGENVNEYNITQGSLANSNYAITFVPAKFTITKKAATVTAVAKSKIYGSQDTELTYTVEGLVGSDKLSGALLRDLGESVNEYNITQGSLANSNYAITYVPAKFTITPKPITVTAAAKSKIYGSQDPELTYTVEGLVGNDKLSGALLREPGENVGEYTITKGSLANSNYAITYIPAKFTVAIKSITVTAEAKNKVYGDADPNLTYSVTGLVSADSLSGNLSRDPGQNVGEYNILQGSLTAGSNYSINYVSAKLTIAKKAITVTAEAKSKIYGQPDPSLTYVAVGLVGGDTLSGSLTRVPGDNVGEYSINQGTLANGNYTITYTPSKLTVNKKTLTVKADDKNKIYGDSNPLLSITYNGFITGESESVLDNKPTPSTNVTTNSNAGQYDITVSGGSDNNYSIEYVKGAFNVEKRAITVTADNKQKINGEQDPGLTYKITSGNLVNNDNFNGDIVRVEGENLTSHTQTYDILQGSLALSNNYLLTFVKGTFTIIPSSECSLISVVSPENTTINGSDITKTVANSIESVLVDLEISNFATWNLYSDSNCTQEILDKTISLNVGNNVAYIKVTAQNDSTNNVYKITVRRRSTNAYLGKLETSNGELSPVFSKDNENYTSIVKGNVDSISVTPTVEDVGNAIVKINGVLVENATASAPIQISYGNQNNILVEVTAEDGNKKTYKINITKLRNNADLMNLATNEGSLSPAFDKNVTSYTVSVANSVTKTTITPTVEDTGKATVKINNYELSNIKQSLPITLNEGLNVVKVSVSAEDGTVKTYTVTINRQRAANTKSSNANLIDLTVNNGILSPAFNKDWTNYTVNVKNSISSINLTPYAEDLQKAEITVNGGVVNSNEATSNYPLQVGENTIKISVKAENGNIKEYVIKVVRAEDYASNNANLSSMMIINGELNTAFDKNITLYTSAVSPETDLLRITANSEDPTATVVINGLTYSNQAAAAVPLKVGSNTITMQVIAQDGTVKEYILIVTRYSNRLTNLELSDGTLSPMFNRNEVLYSAFVENSVTSITLTPTLERPLSTVSISGNVVDNMTESTPVSLNVGVNEIDILVTSEDSKTRNYKVVVIRKPAVVTYDENVLLVNRIIDGFSSDPSNEELAFAKSAIENAVKMYEDLTSSQKASVGSDREVKLYTLYNKLITALEYINKQITSSSSVEATKGFVTNLDTQLMADDGEKLTVMLNVNPMDTANQSKVSGKLIGSSFNITISEIITKVSDRTELARNDNVQPKPGDTITIKIKVPEELKNKKGLDIVYISPNGDVESKYASIVIEGGDTYLVFNAEHFSQYSITYTPDPIVKSTPSTSGIIVKAQEHSGYINGYPDNTFRPEDGITRAEAVAIMARLSSDFNANQQYTNNFNDIEDDSWYENSIGFMQSKNIITGYEDGSFNPEGSITRAEFAVIISKFASLNIESSQSTTFTDVNGHWAEKYISALVQKGYINGYEDGSFKPDAEITRAEAVKIINAAMGRTPDSAKINAKLTNYSINFTDVSAHWAYYEIIEAATKHNVRDFH